MRTWLAAAGGIVLVWLALHATGLRHMGNSIVLDFPSSRERVREPVTPAFQQNWPLPLESINFRADLLRHPVCVGLLLHPARNAGGRLRIRVLADAAPLIEVALNANQIIEGHNRICLALPLERLRQAGTSLEVASDPAAPVSGLDIVMQRPTPSTQGLPGMAVRVEAHAPWSVRQMASAIAILALVLAILWLVVLPLSREGEQVK